EIPVTFVPPGSLTFTGTSLPFVLPSPSWPTMFQPQANTAPLEVRARLWYTPPATGLTFTFCGVFGFEPELPAPEADATAKPSNSRPRRGTQPGARTADRLPEN